MTPFKSSVFFLFFLLVALVILGCATSGPKYIDLAYTGQPESGTPDTLGTMGISRFSDLRSGLTKGGIGHRVLNDKSKEVFLVQGLDLAGTLTDVTQVYLERKGFAVMPTPAWTPTLAGLSKTDTGKDYLVTANINTFECRAVKNGAITKMTMEIDLTLFLAKPATKTLTTKPVALTLERTDINFTRKKVASFFNETLAEVFEKALPFDQN